MWLTATLAPLPEGTRALLGRPIPVVAPVMASVFAQGILGGIVAAVLDCRGDDRYRRGDERGGQV